MKQFLFVAVSACFLGFYSPIEAQTCHDACGRQEEIDIAECEARGGATYVQCQEWAFSDYLWCVDECEINGVDNGNLEVDPPCSPALIRSEVIYRNQYDPTCGCFRLVYAGLKLIYSTCPKR